MSNNQSPVDLVQKYLSDGAYYQLQLDRDNTDSFVVNLICLNPVPSCELLETDLFPILPPGSQWKQAEGWHSYVGIPFSCKGTRWLAVGVEIVRPHPARGAYPIFFAFIYPLDAPPLEGLRRLVDTLDPEGRLENTPGIISASSLTPQEHTKVEGRILRTSISWYSSRRSILFRTLVLTEDEIDGLSRIARYKLWVTPTGERRRSLPRESTSIYIQKGPYLLGMVESIARSFSSGANW